MWILVSAFFVACAACVRCAVVCDEAWTPSWNPDRNDLRCDMDYCKEHNRGPVLQSGIDPVDECCTCRSCSVWPASAERLYIEIVSTVGTNLLVSEDTFVDKHVYSIEYTNKQLRLFPSNMCKLATDGDDKILSRFSEQFSDINGFLQYIVLIDLSYNYVSVVDDINCLTRLDTLDLSNNHIQTLSNTTLNKLIYLRNLNLQKNRIHDIEPNIILAPGMSLQRVNLDNNCIEKLDITNYFSRNPFCEISYKENSITSLVNELGFKLDTDRTYGPGFVDMKKNDIQIFPDFKNLLKLDNLNEIGNLLTFGFDYRGIPLICDCNMAPFMGLAKSTIANLWRDYFGIKCANPENMRNVSIKDFINSNTNLDRLTCDISHDPACYDNCKCTDQPNQNRVIVNCSGIGIDVIPPFVPGSKFSTRIDLDLSHNAIRKLDSMPYFKDINYLSLADNYLEHIDSEAAFLLENASVLDLGNNPSIQTLPSVLQYWNSSSIVMTNNTISCDCDSRWILDWVSRFNATFMCEVKGHGTMPVLNFTIEMLDCDDPNDNFLIILAMVLSIAVLLLSITGLLSYWFRYEILILYIRFKQFTKKGVCPVLTHDVFLSFDEDNDELRVWTNKTLVPFLERVGYKLFLPVRDLQFGDIRDVRIINTLNNTKNFLLILSESYIDRERDRCWTDHEWKYGWNMFKTDRNRNIVVINFDELLTSEMPYPQIKAFLRVGGPLNFSNTERNILQQICNKLGRPQVRQAWTTKNSTFCTSQLFNSDNSKHTKDNSMMDISSRRMEQGSLIRVGNDNDGEVSTSGILLETFTPRKNDGNNHANECRERASIIEPAENMRERNDQVENRELPKSAKHNSIQLMTNAGPGKASTLSANVVSEMPRPARGKYKYYT